MFIQVVTPPITIFEQLLVAPVGILISILPLLVIGMVLILTFRIFERNRDELNLITEFAN